LYHKNATVKPFLGLKLMNEAGEAVGVIHGPFGASDKFRIKFPYGVPESAVAVGTKLFLRTKKYFFEKTKSLLQNGIEIEGSDPRVEQQLLLAEPKEFEERKETAAAEGQDARQTLSQEAAPSLPSHQQISIPEPPQPSTSPAAAPPPLPAHPIHHTAHTPESTDTPPADPSPEASPAPAHQPVVAPVNLAMIGVKKKAPAPVVKKENPSHSPAVDRKPAPPPSATVPAASILAPPSSAPMAAPAPSLLPPQPVAAPAVANFPPNCDTGDLRVGTIDTVKAADSAQPSELVAVVSGCFRMEENIRLLAPRSSSRIVLSSAAGAAGGDPLPAQLLGPFAKLGKCKVQFSSPSPAFRPEEAIGGKVEIHITTAAEAGGG
jgi:hypothetical protein